MRRHARGEAHYNDLWWAGDRFDMLRFRDGWGRRQSRRDECAGPNCNGLNDRLGIV